MRFSHYNETVLEQWIYQYFRSNNVVTPTDLDIEVIAAIFEIDLEYVNCKSFSDNEEMVIFLDRREDPIVTRMIFFHELCHVLRHAGDQRRMPELFKNAQEAEADHFVLYAAMPFYMISQMSLPERRNEAIAYIASEFRVTTEIAEKRIDQIYRRILGGQLLKVANTITRPAQENHHKPEPDANWSDETKRILSQLHRQLIIRGRVANE